MIDTLRHRVRTSVADRVPIDQDEQASIETFLAHYDALVDPMDQELDDIHVTGSAIVTGSRGVVLLRHKRLGLWLQPGGHVDPGETPWQAALREAQEETGLEVRFATLGNDGVPPLVATRVDAATPTSTCGTWWTAAMPIQNRPPARARRSVGSPGRQRSNGPATTASRHCSVTFRRRTTGRATADGHQASTSAPTAARAPRWRRGVNSTGCP